MSQSLPVTYSHTFGSIRSRRGHLEHLKLFSWDVIPKCVNSSCPALALCEFDKTTEDHIVRCGVQTQYLKGTAEMIFENYKHLLTEDEFFQVGMHVMPLYRMLVKLKIHELGVEQAISTSDRGVSKANPVYKEIRETIKSII